MRYGSLLWEFIQVVDISRIHKLFKHQPTELSARDRRLHPNLGPSSIKKLRPKPELDDTPTKPSDPVGVDGSCRDLRHLRERGLFALQPDERDRDQERQLRALLLSVESKYSRRLCSRQVFPPVPMQTLGTPIDIGMLVSVEDGRH